MTKNMFSIRNTILIPCLVTLLCGQIMAQSSVEVSLQFVSFPVANDPEPIQLLLPEAKTMSVEIPTNVLSNTYKVPQSTSWVLGKTTVDSEGKTVFQEYGRADSIASPSQLILVIRKGDAYSDGFDIKVLDNRLANFGGGKFFLMNATDIDIAGELADKKFALKKGNHTIVAPSVNQGERAFHAQFYFRAADRTRPFFSTRWPINDKARSFIFFHNDPDTKRIRLHTIRDFPQ